MISWGNVPLNSTIPFFIDTFVGSTGASVDWSGIAVTDVEIFKGTSMTQRASDAGVVLLDTDGISLDGITGIGGFSIDTSDNSDAGFYAAGSFYTVVVASVTIDSQTVNFVAGTFRLTPAEAIAGHPKVDVGGWLGTAAATPTVNGVPEVDLTHVAGATTDVSALATNVAAILVDTGTTLDGRIPAALVGGRIDASVGAMAANVVTAAAVADGAIDAATLAADTITAAKIAADVTTELQSGLATAAALTTLTNTVGAAGAGLSAVPWNPAWDAEAQSEVNDALVAFFTSPAVLVDLFWDEPLVEPSQGIPSATPALRLALSYLYTALRNKINISSSSKAFYNDAGVVTWKKALSATATDYTEAEGASGP